MGSTVFTPELLLVGILCPFFFTLFLRDGFIGGMFFLRASHGFFGFFLFLFTQLSDFRTPMLSPPKRGPAGPRMLVRRIHLSARHVREVFAFFFSGARRHEALGLV
jgi:hypothetical protein